MPLAERGICPVGGYGLNITNHMAAEAYKKLGMSDIFMSASELLGRENMSGIPLMVTEHRMTPGILTDRKGQRYAVEYNEDMHKSFIFPIL